MEIEQYEWESVKYSTRAAMLAAIVVDFITGGGRYTPRQFLDMYSDENLAKKCIHEFELDNSYPDINYPLKESHMATFDYTRADLAKAFSLYRAKFQEANQNYEVKNKSNGSPRLCKG